MVTLEELVGMIAVPMQNIIKAEAAKELADSRALLEKIFEDDFNTFEEFLKEKDYVRSEDKEDLSVEYIKKEDMTADDVPDDLKEEIVNDYFSLDSYAALEKAWDNFRKSME